VWVSIYIAAVVDQPDAAGNSLHRFMAFIVGIALLSIETFDAALVLDQLFA
jgi:hypothetical protein